MEPWEIETKKRDKMFGIIAELEQYAELESSEWSQAAYAMTTLWHQRTLLSTKLRKALEQEITDWLLNKKLLIGS